MSTEILKELKYILTQENNINKNIISLYDISLIEQKEAYNFNQMLSNNINKKITQEKYINIIIHNFNFDTNELNFTLDYYQKYHLKCFKINKKLYIKTINKNDEIYLILYKNKELSDIYDEYIKYKDYIKNNNCDCIPINSNFVVNINNQKISINSVDEEFTLNSNNCTHLYTINTNNQSINEILTGNEEEIFKRIYVYIHDCPEWMQDTLYKIRKQQISNYHIKKKKKH